MLKAVFKKTSHILREMRFLGVMFCCHCAAVPNVFIRYQGRVCTGRLARSSLVIFSIEYSPVHQMRVHLVNLDIRGVVFISIYLHNAIWKYVLCERTLFKKAFIVTVVGYSEYFLTALVFAPWGCSLTQLGLSSCLADNWKRFVFTSGAIMSLAGQCMQ